MGSLKTSLVFLALAAALPAAAGEEKTVSIADCTFQADPQEFLARQSRARFEVYDRARKFSRAVAKTAATQPVNAADILRRSFIDDEIFGKLDAARVRPAPFSTDEEFLRRIYLDLTGRLPAPDVIRAFLDDPDPTKRDAVIDRLLYSPEFTDRWTIWLGDLLQVNAVASNFNRQPDGRNAFWAFVYRSIGYEKSLREIAQSSVTMTGNNYNSDTGATNFAVNSITPMGPAQDQYDSMLVKTATAFLGLAHYDCLLCHDGRRHLDEISLWGKSTVRLDAQKMAAFFSRMRTNGNPAKQGDFLYQSRDVTDVATGQYDLNTTAGNRPNRQPVGTLRNLTPEYRTGGAPSNGDWRRSFADFMVQDPMFARNLANRIWKQLFGLGLVEPVDTLDPARLDPANPPPAPWGLQATHPQLLEKLARDLTDKDFNLREFLRIIVQSSAYQLSSHYDGEWKLDYVPLFARHYPRRLEGEEIHDAILTATGTTASYNVRGLEPIAWALQLPDSTEPRGTAAANFMNVFLRGDRDTQPRSQAGSILQQLYLMNDNFVMSRVRKTASPVLQAISRMTDNGAVLEELFLRFLSRRPTDYEKDRGLAFLARYGTTAAGRDAAIEDLAWVCINKIDFLYSY